MVAASLPLYAAPTLYRLRGKRREMAVIQQLKLAAFVLLIGLAVVLLLAVTSDYASGGDYTVTRSTAIESQRPIWLLVTEAGLGVIDGLRTSPAGATRRPLLDSELSDLSSSLRIDGSPAPGIGGVASAVWRLVGFVVWNADGRIERVTDLQFRGRSVRIVDAVSNGRVWVRVVVGPPLGDPRVRFAVLQLEAVENAERFFPFEHERFSATTRIDVSCSAVIDLPGRCRIVRRLAQRIADREAGPELSRVIGLATAGRAAVLDGRGRLTDSVVAEFLETVCR